MGQQKQLAKSSRMAPRMPPTVYGYGQAEGVPELTRSAVLEGMPPEDLMASKSLWGSTDSAASRSFAFVLS